VKLCIHANTYINIQGSCVLKSKKWSKANSHQQVDGKRSHDVSMKWMKIRNKKEWIIDDRTTEMKIKTRTLRGRDQT
jgi:hypothetical protein